MITEARTQLGRQLLQLGAGVRVAGEGAGVGGGDAAVLRGLQTPVPTARLVASVQGGHGAGLLHRVKVTAHPLPVPRFGHGGVSAVQASLLVHRGCEVCVHIHGNAGLVAGRSAALGVGGERQGRGREGGVGVPNAVLGRGEEGGRCAGPGCARLAARPRP